jgi:formylglycine-generating enzyme required for sulfatase activity
MAAAVENDNVQVVRALLQLGVPPDSLNRDGRPVLLHTFLARDEPLTRVLLEAGADPNHAFELVLIPGGRFRMGSPATEAKRRADEGPQVEVEVEPLYMGKFEVTWELYNAFLATYGRLSMTNYSRPPPGRLADAVTYPTPLYNIEAGPMLDRMGGFAGRYPAVTMTRFAARQFTKWLSKKTGRFYRLPSEAEWEYACRAGTTTVYSFGDNPKHLVDYGWFVDNSVLKDGDPGYRQVGQKRPNPWGLHDMHGNVAEWVVDQYAADSYALLAGRGVISASKAVRWPIKRYPGVIRGGGYESEWEECRSAARYVAKKALNNTDPQDPKSPHWEAAAYWVGFRIVSPLREPPEAEKLRWWNADDPVTIESIKRDREIQELIAPPATRPVKQ